MSAKMLYKPFLDINEHQYGLMITIQCPKMSAMPWWVLVLYIFLREGKGGAEAQAHYHHDSLKITSCLVFHLRHRDGEISVECVERNLLCNDVKVGFLAGSSVPQKTRRLISLAPIISFYLEAKLWQPTSLSTTCYLVLMWKIKQLSMLSASLIQYQQPMAKA